MATKLKTCSTLLLNKGKGEDKEEEDEEVVEEPLKKKGKVISTKPAKPSTSVFTRRSSIIYCVIFYIYEDLKMYGTSMMTHTIPLKLGAKLLRKR